MHDHYDDDEDDEDDVADDDGDDDDDNEDHDQETRRACIGLPWRGNTMAACASPLSGFSSWNLVLEYFFKFTCWTLLGPSLNKVDLLDVPLV